jgi:hypothetical protein
MWDARSSSAATRTASLDRIGGGLLEVEVIEGVVERPPQRSPASSQSRRWLPARNLSPARRDAVGDGPHRLPQ